MILRAGCVRSLHEWNIRNRTYLLILQNAGFASSENEASQTSKPLKEDAAAKGHNDEKVTGRPRPSKLMTVLAGMKVDGSSSKRKNSASQRDGSVTNESITEATQEEISPRGKRVPSGIDPQLIGATEKIAEVLSSKIDPATVKSELLTQLLDHAARTEKAKVATGNLSHLIAGMKIDRAKPPTEMGEKIAIPRHYEEAIDAAQGPARALLEPMMQEELKDLDTRNRRAPHQQRRITSHERVDLFGGKPIGIFRNVEELRKKEQTTLKTWVLLEEEALKVKLAPKNAYEEMINWTKEGKLWRFPIDNEQGVLDHETDVDFSEHVFLDNLIADFPKKGPIKQFMDLVIYGLSRNAFLTRKEKEEYVDWYRTYFKKKMDILVDVMGEELSSFTQRESRGDETSASMARAEQESPPEAPPLQDKQKRRSKKSAGV